MVRMFLFQGFTFGLKHVNETTVFLNFITFLTYVSKPRIWQLNDQRIAILQVGRVSCFNLLFIYFFSCGLRSTDDGCEPSRVVLRGACRRCSCQSTEFVFSFYYKFYS